MGSKKKAKKSKKAERKPRASFVESSGLKLEYGKRYVRRDGLVTDPLTEGYLGPWPFNDPKYGWTYTKEGLNGAPGIETKHDLVRECSLQEAFCAALDAEPCPEPLLVVCSDKATREVVSAVLAELEAARKVFPSMASLHEAFSILLEEVDELKAEVQKKQLVRERGRDKKVPNLIRTTEAKKEAIQVAAMAMRLIIDCCLKSGTSYGK